MYLIVSHHLTVLPLPLYLSQLQTSSTIAVGQAMPACMTYIVISTFIKRYLKAKHARAPAYSRTLRLIKEGFPNRGQVKLRSAVEMSSFNFQHITLALSGESKMVPKFTDIPQHTCRSLGLQGQIPASQVRPTSIRENSYAVYIAILQRPINYRDYL